MKNLKFKTTDKKILETTELFGKQGVYKACIDEQNFYGWILEVEQEFSKCIYHFEHNNLNEIKKNIKFQLESLGVKFEKQIRSKPK